MQHFETGKDVSLLFLVLEIPTYNTISHGDVWFWKTLDGTLLRFKDHKSFLRDSVWVGQNWCTDVNCLILKKLITAVGFENNHCEFY